jgi:hypothetical protein
MHSGWRPARERIITAELMKLERRQAIERAERRAGSRGPVSVDQAPDTRRDGRTAAPRGGGPAR